MNTVFTRYLIKHKDKVWGFYGGDYEECPLLGSRTVWLLQEATPLSFRSVFRLLDTANVFLSLPIIIIPKREAICSS
jgi:hypothetical protein